MAVLNIRNVPNDLAAKVRLESARLGKSIQQYVIDKLGEGLSRVPVSAVLPNNPKPAPTSRKPFSRAPAKIPTRGRAMVARSAHNRKAAGSSPVPATKSEPQKAHCRHGLIYCTQCEGHH